MINFSIKNKMKFIYTEFLIKSYKRTKKIISKNSYSVYSIIIDNKNIQTYLENPVLKLVNFITKKKK